MKTTVPEGISLWDIYKSIVPFVGLQIIGLLIMILYLPLTTFTPSLVVD